MAHNARVWNHWIGGTDHYPVDRRVRRADRRDVPGDPGGGPRGPGVPGTGGARFLATLAGGSGSSSTSARACRPPRTRTRSRSAIAPRVPDRYADNDPTVHRARPLLLTSSPGGRHGLPRRRRARPGRRPAARAAATLDLSRPVAVLLHRRPELRRTPGRPRDRPAAAGGGTRRQPSRPHPSDVRRRRGEARGNVAAMEFWNAHAAPPITARGRAEDRRLPGRPGAGVEAGPGALLAVARRSASAAPMPQFGAVAGKRDSGRALRHGRRGGRITTFADPVPGGRPGDLRRVAALTADLTGQGRGRHRAGVRRHGGHRPGQDDPPRHGWRRPCPGRRHVPGVRHLPRPRPPSSPHRRPRLPRRASPSRLSPDLDQLGGAGRGARLGLGAGGPGSPRRSSATPAGPERSSPGSSPTSPTGTASLIQAAVEIEWGQGSAPAGLRPSVPAVFGVGRRTARSGRSGRDRPHRRSADRVRCAGPDVDQPYPEYAPGQFEIRWARGTRWPPPTAVCWSARPSGRWPGGTASGVVRARGVRRVAPATAAICTRLRRRRG